jgi:hypothetical protein
LIRLNQRERVGFGTSPIFSPHEPPSTADLRTTRVEPGSPLTGAWLGSRSRSHWCAACGERAMLETSKEPALATGPFSLLALGSSSVSQLTRQRWHTHSCGTEKERGKSELGFGVRASSTGFDRTRKPRERRMRLGRCNSLDRQSGPGAHEFFWPKPTWQP